MARSPARTVRLGLRRFVVKTSQGKTRGSSTLTEELKPPSQGREAIPRGGPQLQPHPDTAHHDGHVVDDI